MAYSNKKIPNDPSLFPPQQEWMTWVEDAHWSYERNSDGSPKTDANGGYIRIVNQTGEGKLRHHYTVADAKKRLAWIGSKSKYRGGLAGIFSVDWALYHWENGEWIQVYAGKAGESRDLNPLFKRRLKKDEREHPLDRAQEEAAIKSILLASVAS